MDARRELAELIDVSGDLEQVIVLDDGGVVASTLPDDRARAFEEAVRDVVAVAERVKPGAPAPLRRLAAAADAGSLFVVRGERLTGAGVTRPSPVEPLVMHDLGSLVRRLEEGADASA